MHMANRQIIMSGKSSLFIPTPPQKKNKNKKKSKYLVSMVYQSSKDIKTLPIQLESVMPLSIYNHPDQNVNIFVKKHH